MEVRRRRARRDNEDADEPALGQWGGLATGSRREVEDNVVEPRRATKEDVLQGFRAPPDLELLWQRGGAQADIGRGVRVDAT